MSFPWIWIAVGIGAVFVYLNITKAKQDISNYKKKNQEKINENIHKDRR